MILGISVSKEAVDIIYLCINISFHIYLVPEAFCVVFVIQVVSYRTKET